jgi:hypothetical protein
MTKKSKRSKSPLEAAVTTARKIWGTRTYDPAAPLVPPTTGYIDGQHVLMAFITSDVDKAALATTDGLLPMEQGELDTFNASQTSKGSKVVVDAKPLGFYSVPMLLEALTYLKGIGCDVVTLKQLKAVGDMDNKRVLTFIIAPRVEDGGEEDFGDDDEDEK